MLDHGGHHFYLKNKRNTDFMTAVDRIENECVNSPPSNNDKSYQAISSNLEMANKKAVPPVRKAIMMKRYKEELNNTLPSNHIQLLR
jgi:hypothetical protein